MIIGISINSEDVIELRMYESVWPSEEEARTELDRALAVASGRFHPRNGLNKVWRVPKNEYMNWLLAMSSNFFALLRKMDKNETDIIFLNFDGIFRNSSEISTEAEATRKLFVTLLRRRNIAMGLGTSTDYLWA